ncbi:terminase gpA endonuclease subunit [Croceicoccus gelatinilyticus]|uniref:terminase gpA endonuclease subunit n=1 Tax=Croceicoccus gelatinilyticus TaxID=2835536 RepID=UPI001BCE7C6A|nr:terminase gpA endonuclease subunit [Croceicoccus gelatinilyticus]MBS7669346.1 phage terminase large subunit family protein [Croceicoccus gelatinilyticus]
MLEHVGQHDALSFVDVRAMVGSCLQQMRFPERVAISTSAERHRELDNPGAYSGRWGGGPFFVEHLNRIMDCLWSESPYRECGVMGPSQVGKSEIGNNWQLHTIIYDQADMLFIGPDRVLIEGYVKKEFEKMISNAVECDGVAAAEARLLPGAGSDTIHLKRFYGADFFFYWPTGSRLRALPFSRIRLDDLDEIPTDINDQGDAISLARGRMGSFSAFGQTMLYVNSSPKLGPRAGIEAFVSAGTNERLWVDCLECHFPFAMEFERLDFDRGGSPADAAASAAMICPDCGSVHPQQLKRRLMETFRWVGRGETAVSRKDEETGKTGELEANTRASFRLDGVQGFRPWSEIARLAREAEIALEYEQDESKLKSFDQTILGRNYRARQSGEAPVSEDELVTRSRASAYAMGEVPPGVEILIASIDQQGNRFEVAVWGFGQHFRAWLIDRFPILTVEEDGKQRPLRPFTRPEDWGVIHEKVMSRTYPLAGAPHLRMKLFNTAVDTGGLDSATDNAFAWWHAMVTGDAGSGRAPIPPTALTLIKGGNNPKARKLPPPTIDAKRQIKGAPQAELYVPNVSRLKHIANTALNRREDGPGYVQFPFDVPIEYLAELRAETLQGDVWVRDPHDANETWDLMIYARTVLLRFGGDDSALGWVPEWARPPRGAPAKLERAPIDTKKTSDAEPEPSPVVQIAKPQKSARMRTRPRRTIRSRRAG